MQAGYGCFLQTYIVGIFKSADIKNWWLKKTKPYNNPRNLVPKIWATIPTVAGTVDNQRIPKLAPKIIELIVLGGVKINKQMDIPLKK